MTPRCICCGKAKRVYEAGDHPVMICRACQPGFERGLADQFAEYHRDLTKRWVKIRQDIDKEDGAPDRT